MATCKDCLHYEPCYSGGVSVWNNIQQTEEDHCRHFKDRSQYAEVKHGENITKQHPVDEFICSECGLIMRDLTEVRIDEENEDECYYEFEFKYCPNCGAKMDGGEKK